MINTLLIILRKFNKFKKIKKLIAYLEYKQWRLNLKKRVKKNDNQS